MWLLIPALASSPGWTARAVRDSAVARFIDRVAPEPPSESETLGRLVGDQSFPEVFDTLTSPDAGTPPPDGIPAEAAGRVTRSTVLVEGQACDRVQEGTGFVAGHEPRSSRTRTWSRGRTAPTSSRPTAAASTPPSSPSTRTATSRCCARPGSACPRSPEATDTSTTAARSSATPAVVRCARRRCASPSRSSPAAPTSTAARRPSASVFVLAAVTAPGDSGGPVVDTEGRVIGVMFAYDISRETTAYALTRTELDAVLQPVLGRHRATVARHRGLPHRIAHLRERKRPGHEARVVRRNGVRWRRGTVSRPR